MIAHNANDDSRFILKYIGSPRCLVKGGRFLSIQGKFLRSFDKNSEPIEIKIKDICKMIPMRLKDFAACFGLDECKEVMPYKLYTKANIVRKFISMPFHAIHHIKETDVKQWTNNIDKWECRNTGANKKRI